MAAAVRLHLHRPSHGSQGGGYVQDVVHKLWRRQGHSFGGQYRELVPNSRIRYSDTFDDPNLPGEMETTVVLAPVSCGTDVTIVQSGLPAMIPMELCYLGWQESLAQLATLVEPVIPG